MPKSRGQKKVDGIFQELWERLEQMGRWGDRRRQEGSRLEGCGLRRECCEGQEGTGGSEHRGPSAAHRPISA